MNDDKRAGILRSYHAACTTVSDFLSLDDTYGLLRYSPTVLVRIIFNAGFVIFKILNSLLSQFINYDEGVRLFHMAQVVLRRMSVIENDLAIRGSNVLAGIWESKNDDPTEVTQDPSLTMTSHLTACLTYDASWRWNIHRLKVNETNGVPSKEWGMFPFPHLSLLTRPFHFEPSLLSQPCYPRPDTCPLTHAPRLLSNSSHHFHAYTLYYKQ